MSLYSAHQMMDLDQAPQGVMKLQNKTTKPFTTAYRDDQNLEHMVTFKPKEIKEFPYWLGLVIRTHLANHILYHSKFDYKTDVNKKLSEIKEEITV